ncbi:MAG: hypothetical protein ABFS14_10125 [Gemmatimonadota bacterium]
MSHRPAPGDEPAHVRLARDLRPVLMHGLGLNEAGRSVIGIGGESCAGKSVTAPALAAEFSGAGVQAAVLDQDGYFLLPPRANHLARSTDLSRVGPQEVDLGRLEQHIAAYRDGAEFVDVPVTDRKTDTFVSRRLSLAGVRVLIVEGTYVLSLPDLDARLFLSGTYQETWDRRRQRNRDQDEPVIGEVLAIEHQLIVTYKEVADIVVDCDLRVLSLGRFGGS